MKKLIELFAKGYVLLVHVASLLKSPLLLIIRLYWGWQTSLSGYRHLTHIADVTAAFKGWGVPFPQISVYASGSTELIFGMFLLLGLGSRIITIPLIGNFCVAYLTASRDTLLHIFDDPDKFVSDDAFLFLLAAVIVFVFGPGVFSLDWIIGKIYRKKKAE